MKQLERKSKHLHLELEKQMQDIKGNPLVGSRLKGDLKELLVFKFKFKGIDLRICYVYYEEDNHIIFVYAGTRENFYAEVKKFVKK